MSNILWSIGQLVDNPSETIINTLQKHIFRKSNGESVTISSKTTARQNQDDKHNSNESVPVPSCSSKGPKELRSKQTQVGTGLRNQSLTQCSVENVLKRTSTATSVLKINHMDRKVGPSQVHLTKDDCIETDSIKICEEHQQAFAILRKWPAGRKTSEAQKISSNKVSLLKYKLLEALKYLQLEKIQSIPQYRSTDREFLKLYKSVDARNIKVILSKENSQNKKLR